MAGVVAGLLTSGVVKVASDKLSSAIAEQAGLLWNFSNDLEGLKGTMESMAAVLKDAEKQSVKSESVRLWLERLEDAALDITDMMDDYQHTEQMPEMFSFLTAARKKKALANKMKNMRERLEKINKERQNFNFALTTGASQEQQHYDQRETSSAVNEAKILGRDGEKKEIIDILSASDWKDGTMVLPIHGLGGMGKTTLAQLVYNDTRFKQYEHRVWVYVSQEFHLKKIGRSIISQLSTDGGQQDWDTLQMISQRLDKLLLGKKILIVLDDIWEEDALELDKLKHMLHVAKKGSMVDVLVTTRSECIANKICTNKPHEIQPLNDNVCWDIIKRYSGFEEKSNKVKLEQLGLDIAKKCRGVPLAAQALGYVLKTEDLTGWSEMNKNDIWNNESSEVLPSLKLSYERMLPIPRLCFSYCAIFPKGHVIHEDDLIYQWISLDFIKKPSDGKKYIKQLLGMSFLQHSKFPQFLGRRATWYTMHDLVHDLARSVIGDKLTMIDVEKKSYNTSQQNYCRYVMLTNYYCQTKLSNILPKKVRALHFSSSSRQDLHDVSFSFAKCLRILYFSGHFGIILPSSIGQLNQLKCLIAPNMENERLPESIAELPKLQYLNMRSSNQMSALPESIVKLSGLMYLCLSGCYHISEVPESFGGLKSLMHLNMSGCSEITSFPRSLGHLTNLRHLDLSRCTRVQTIPESLGGLSQLQHLDLSGCKSITSLPEGIGSLTNLQYLNLEGSKRITKLPGSLQNLQNLVHLDLSNCPCVEGLPEALRGLTALEHLNMSCFVISDDLCIPGDLFDAMGNLTNLRYLNLEKSMNCTCPDFIGALTNLEHLVLSGNSLISSLPESIGNLKKLQMLDLSRCVNLQSAPDRISEITTLKSVRARWCSYELTAQVSSKLHYSVALPDLTVRADDINAGSNLTLLEDVNVPELIIRSLENVRFSKEADKVKLLDKSNLSDLTMAWTLHANRFLDDKDLLGQLVPPRGLEHLSLKGYNSPSFPSWLMGISYHLPNLRSITLASLPKCGDLPPLGQLPNLRDLSLEYCPWVTKIDKDFCGGKGAFSVLSVFNLRDMEGLEEWSTTYSFEDGDPEEFMFPMLLRLYVSACPALRLKPCLPRFDLFDIRESDKVISSLEEIGNNIGHLAPYIPSTMLIIRGSDSKRLRLFHHFPALKFLGIEGCPNLMSLPESMRHLAALLGLYIYRCPNLTSLSESMRHLASLAFLSIDTCPNLTSLPEGMRHLASLERLELLGCDGISALPEWMGDLSSLKELSINNPELKRWCESEENKKKLAHINKITYYD